MKQYMHDVKANPPFLSMPSWGLKVEVSKTGGAYVPIIFDPKRANIDKKTLLAVKFDLMRIISYRSEVILYFSTP